jgi:hypothetical protein
VPYNFVALPPKLFLVREFVQRVVPITFSIVASIHLSVSCVNAREMERSITIHSFASLRNPIYRISCSTPGFAPFHSAPPGAIICHPLRGFSSRIALPLTEIPINSGAIICPSLRGLSKYNTVHKLYHQQNRKTPGEGASFFRGPTGQVSLRIKRNRSALPRTRLTGG